MNPASGRCELWPSLPGTAAQRFDRDILEQAAAAHALDQNFPTPFNATTTIAFTIPVHSLVPLTVFDTLGREVASLLCEPLPAGTHIRQWDASGWASGIYFCRLQAGAFLETRRHALLR